MTHPLSIEIALLPRTRAWMVRWRPNCRCCQVTYGPVTLRMVAAANMVEVAALVGDTTRATMLAALMDGQALTASELAARTRITKSTASGHLTKLVDARLLAV